MSQFGICAFGCTAVAAAMAVAAEPTDRPDAAPPPHADATDSVGEFDERPIRGWTVRISRRLLAEDGAATVRALELLEKQLADIVRVVPERARKDLQNVTLWLSPTPDGQPPRAEYHPAADWLREHGRNPAMARGVEFTNIPNFAEECRRMPWFTLHELAHAWHHQVLGFERPDILAAFEAAKESGRYNEVKRWTGKAETRDRAYALTDHKEYFAESTEAFFGRNDFEPFDRDELKAFDPRMERLLETLWNDPPKREAARP